MKRKRLGIAGRCVRAVLILLLLIIFIALLGITVYIIGMTGLIRYAGEGSVTMDPKQVQEYIAGQKETFDPSYQGKEIESDSITWEQAEGVSESDKQVLHILLVGTDARPGESYARSDAMILCSLNTQAKQLTVTSFMRDMYVPIPGYVDHKLNSAYAWGGIPLLKETLLKNFGIETDMVFVVDFAGFEQAVDAVGGVDIYLTGQEAAYLGEQCFREGINHLNGADALTYARIRSIGSGDFDRTARQRNVIGALTGKMQTMTPMQLHAMLEKLLPLITTDGKHGEILELLSRWTPMLIGDYKTVSLQIPGSQAYQDAWVADMAVLLPDLAKNREILHEEIYKKDATG